MIESGLLPDHHHFEHEAMKTTFSLRILGGSGETARGMALECFELIDSLENRLSRYVDDSDVSLINSMQAGETFYMSEPCYECLRMALDMYARTGGLFDITQGKRIEHRKEKLDGPPPPIEGQLTLHPDTPAITCGEPGREIDLGGIGKGFALDQLRSLLIDWGAEGGLVAAGASTLLAFGDTEWPVDLTWDSQTRRITLCNRALSASGTEIQGSHIVDPRGEIAGECAGRLWVVAGTAAVADAMSTAMMLMEREEMGEFFELEKLVESVFVDDGGVVKEVGSGG